MILIEPTEKYSPSSLTAYERYEALIPILSEASEAYLRLYSEQKSDKRDAEIGARLKALFEKVARNSAMSLEEAKRAFLGYTAKGIAGLMTPTPIDAKRCVLDARGTWELSARYTNGGNSKHSRGGDFKTHARSNIWSRCGTTRTTIRARTRSRGMRSTTMTLSSLPRCRIRSSGRSMTIRWSIRPLPSWSAITGIIGRRSKESPGC